MGKKGRDMAQSLGDEGGGKDYPLDMPALPMKAPGPEAEPQRTSWILQI